MLIYNLIRTTKSGMKVTKHVNQVSVDNSTKQYHYEYFCHMNLNTYYRSNLNFTNYVHEETIFKKENL